MAPPLLDRSLPRSPRSSSAEEAARRCAAGTLEPEHVWSLLLALRSAAPSLPAPTLVSVDATETLVVGADAAQPAIALDGSAPRGWRNPAPDRVQVTDAAALLLDLFVPLCTGAGSADRVVGHLAQSLDGRVATVSGSSQFISGREDLLHTHRLRAMFDAVIVGARTVEHDDPQLTTRRVRGPHPTRVVLDPRGRLGGVHRVFTSTDAPTVLVRGTGAPDWEGPAHVDQLRVPLTDGQLDVQALRKELAAMGLRRLFVEGGGITVSGFIRAGALDRLHLAIAPVLMGSGRPSVLLPQIQQLDEALRLHSQHFSLGADVLFDCPLPT